MYIYIYANFSCGVKITLRQSCIIHKDVFVGPTKWIRTTFSNLTLSFTCVRTVHQGPYEHFPGFQGCASPALKKFSRSPGRPGVLQKLEGLIERHWFLNILRDVVFLGPLSCCCCLCFLLFPLLSLLSSSLSLSFDVIIIVVLLLCLCCSGSCTCSFLVIVASLSVQNEHFVRSLSLT